MKQFPSNPLCAPVIGTLARLQFTSLSEYPPVAQVLTDTINEHQKAAGNEPLSKAEIHHALAELVRFGLVRVQDDAGSFHYSQHLRQRLQLKTKQFAVLTALLEGEPLDYESVYKHAFLLYPFRSDDQVGQVLTELVNAELVKMVEQPSDGSWKYTHYWYGLSTNKDPESDDQTDSDDSDDSLLTERMDELENILDKFLSDL